MIDLNIYGKVRTLSVANKDFLKLYLKNIFTYHFFKKILSNFLNSMTYTYLWQLFNWYYFDFL